MNDTRTLTLLFSKPAKVIPTILVHGSDGEINFANENDERLSDRQEAKDCGVLANVANITPTEPLLGIPEAEQNEYENAADNYPNICASK